MIFFFNSFIPEITFSVALTQLQPHHVYSTLERRGNGCFHVVSTLNTGGVFVGRKTQQSYAELIQPKIRNT